MGYSDFFIYIIKFEKVLILLHGNVHHFKDWFMAGYDEMLRRIEPEKIICYNTPFPEMRGDIVFVDYERSSWKYMSYDRSFAKQDLEAFKIGGAPSLTCDTIEPFLIGGGAFKGGGSAYGADWKPNPNKPNDKKFIGKPGDMNQTFDKHGELYETHIGPDGKADYEIHHSDHGNANEHVNPHAHAIAWDTVGPHFNPLDLPGKQFNIREECLKMATFVPSNTPEQNRFQTISDFKWCMQCGGEIDFLWNGTEYGATPDHGGGFIVYHYNKPDTTVHYDTVDNLLGYMVGSDRLRDVITQVTVLDRTI